MTDQYTTKVTNLSVAAPYVDLAFRRTLPFMDRVGLAKPLNQILAECYVQGFKDAVEGMKKI